MDRFVKREPLESVPGTPVCINLSGGTIKSDILVYFTTKICFTVPPTDQFDPAQPYHLGDYLAQQVGADHSGFAQVHHRPTRRACIISVPSTMPFVDPCLPN